MKWIQDRTSAKPRWKSEDGRWEVTYSNFNTNELYHLIDSAKNRSAGCYTDWPTINAVAEGKS